MKNMLFTFCFLLSLLAPAFSLPGASSAVTLPPTCVAVPAGTFVLLETAERISSERLTVGKQVMLRVRTNVVKEGKVVITSGALAIGRVKSIRKNTFNLPEMIIIEATAVQTVDGNMIALSGNEQSYEGYFPGESMVVEPGQSITATLMNNEYIIAQ